MTEQIEILILPSGQTRVQTTGFSGPRCRSVSKFLEEALGSVSSETLTLDYFLFAREQQSQQQHE